MPPIIHSLYCKTNPQCHETTPRTTTIKSKTKRPNLALPLDRVRWRLSRSYLEVEGAWEKNTVLYCGEGITPDLALVYVSPQVVDKRVVPCHTSCTPRHHHDAFNPALGISSSLFVISYRTLANIFLPL